MATRKEKELRSQLKTARKEARFDRDVKTLQRLRTRRGRETGFALGQNVREFGLAGQQEIDFSAEQEALGSLFGGGEKIWGTEREPVKIYNDLNPRQRGDTGTAELFGFG